MVVPTGSGRFKENFPGRDLEPVGSMDLCSVFSSPFLSESQTLTLLVCNSEASFHVVDGALDDEFAELLPPPA